MTVRAMLLGMEARAEEIVPQEVHRFGLLPTNLPRKVIKVIHTKNEKGGRCRI